MRPTGITANKTRKVLGVTWDDGSASEIAFKLLSEMCPCEVCVMERAAFRDDPNPLKLLPAKSDELDAINAVGSYGVNLIWKGGCRYGIYTWEYLARLADVTRVSPPID